MAKTEATKQAEIDIYRATAKQGVFGCFEVTIGWFGSERVDYLTYDTSGIFRCYEIKVSKSDFRSKAANTFVGHYNYYVLTQDLYEQVKDEIPAHIGVYVGQTCVKRPKRQELKTDVTTLKNSLIRSLSREVDKQIRSEFPSVIEYYKRKVRELETEREQARNKADEWYLNYYKLEEKIIAKLGDDWHKQLFEEGEKI